MKNKYFKLIIIILLVIVSASCSTPVNNETDETIIWINKHEKPIVVYKYDDINGNRYTLFSADGQIYDTGWAYNNNSIVKYACIVKPKEFTN